MKRLITLLIAVIVFTWLPTARAEVLKKFSWDELKSSGQLTAGEIVPAESPEQGPVLKIENPKDEPNHIQLLELKDPGVTEWTYAFTGQIRYEHVKGKSYLEMWSYFPDGSHFFSRTLGDRGVTKHLEGSSDWRPFVLPFFMSKETTTWPNRLVVNLVFEGSGTVYLGPLSLEQYDNPQAALKVPGAWWDEQTGGWLGGIFGVVLGCLGGLIGILAGRCRARRFVMATMLATTILGVVLFIVGLIALLAGQPYAVHYPLLLAGVIMTAVFGFMQPGVRRRYEQVELDRIAAMDLGVTPG